jgi:hypothetical protein
MMMSWTGEWNPAQIVLGTAMAGYLFQNGALLLGLNGTLKFQNCV